MPRWEREWWAHCAREGGFYFAVPPVFVFFGRIAAQLFRSRQIFDSHSTSADIYKYTPRTAQVKHSSLLVHRKSGDTRCASRRAHKKVARETWVELHEREKNIKTPCARRTRLCSCLQKNTRNLNCDCMHKEENLRIMQIQLLAYAGFIIWFFKWEQALGFQAYFYPCFMWSCGLKTLSRRHIAKARYVPRWSQE